MSEETEKSYISVLNALEERISKFSWFEYYNNQNCLLYGFYYENLEKGEYSIFKDIISLELLIEYVLRYFSKQS